MSVVPLVSGGLDSTVMSLLIKEEGIEQFPLFIDYGQRSRDLEIEACRRVFGKNGLPTPIVATLPGYGALISSGLTDTSKRLFEDAFLPGRNLFFILLGGAVAYQKGAQAVAIGLLNERSALFPDQTRDFLEAAEMLLGKSLGKAIRVTAPLMAFSKQDVVALAESRGIAGTHSCHAGTPEPCGVCVACRQYQIGEA